MTVFQTSKNRIFATFPHIPPPHSPSRIPNFFALSGGYFDQRNPLSSSLTNSLALSLSEGIASQPTFPIIFSHIPPSNSPFRGILRGDFGEKAWEYLRNIDNPWTNSRHLGTTLGTGLGKSLGACPGTFWEEFQGIAGNSRGFRMFLRNNPLWKRRKPGICRGGCQGRKGYVGDILGTKVWVYF